MKTKILLDTDIGTDVDDAICLAYLLANPNCELVGITTVTGESEKRAMLASSLCKIAGKNIPIYPGIENPLIIEQLQKKAQQAKALINGLMIKFSQNMKLLILCEELSAKIPAK